MTVIDASILVAALIDPGPYGRWAEKVLAGESPSAPHLVLAEASSVLRRSIANASLGSVEADAAHADLANTRIELFGFAPFAERIWELRHTVTPHDAWYVALAEALDAPLATIDERLARAPGPRCGFLLPTA